MANHIIVSSAQAFAQADIPKRTETEWAEIIRSDLGRAVEGIIAAGAHLQQAKSQLGHGRFLPLLKSIGLHERSAERLMKIAANIVLANPTHGSKLPTSMRTLYELSTLPVQLLEAKISDGTITPDIERRDVEQLKRKKSSDDEVEVDGKTVERKSLADQLKAAKTEIEKLKARLERGDGSLFDLKLDSAEEIGKALADNMSEQRFDIAVKAAKARYKAKRQKPAG